MQRAGLRVERAIESRSWSGATVRDLAQERDASIALLVGRREDLERADELLPVLADLVDGLEDGGRLGAQLRVLSMPSSARRAPSWS